MQSNKRSITFVELTLTLTCFFLQLSKFWINCDHILFIHTSVTYSHRVSTWPLVTGLAEKGHQVTFIGPYGARSPTESKNIHEIRPLRLAEFMKNVEAAFDVTHRASGVTPKMLQAYDEISLLACAELLKSEEFISWMKSSPKVDLVISDTTIECVYGIAHKLNAKYALFIPAAFMSKYFDVIGMLSDTSIPDWDISFKPPLSFAQRVIGFFIPLMWSIKGYIYFTKYETLFKEELSLDRLPDLYSFERNISLVLISGDFLEDFPLAYPPLVVKVPGLHIEMTPLKLENSLDSFINSKDVHGHLSDGFIYISFGTVAKGPNLPLEIRTVFFNTIKSFANIRFIWRWDGPTPAEYPENVLFVKWLDQQALLAHPKIKGFIMQAGKPSSQEALFNGVPTITFPILGDQDFNANRLEMLGKSINLELAEINEEKLNSAVSKILSDPRFTERAKQLSILANDVPMKSKDVAVWWTEYILRHSQEELSLRKPQQSGWIQSRNVDVIIFVFSVVVILAALSCKCFCSGCNKICSQRNPASSRRRKIKVS